MVWYQLIANLPNGAHLVICLIRISPWRIIWLCQAFPLLMGYYFLFIVWQILGQGISTYLFPVIFTAFRQSRWEMNASDGYVELFSNLLVMPRTLKKSIIVRDITRLGATAQNVIFTLQILKRLNATVYSLNQLHLDLFAVAHIWEIYLHELKRIQTMFSHQDAALLVEEEDEADPDEVALREHVDDNWEDVMEELDNEDSERSMILSEAVARGETSKINQSIYKVLATARKMIEDNNASEKSVTEAVEYVAKKGFGTTLKPISEEEEDDLLMPSSSDKKRFVVITRSSNIPEHEYHIRKETHAETPAKQTARCMLVQEEVDPNSELVVYHDVGDRNHCHPFHVYLLKDAFEERVGGVAVNDLARLHGDWIMIILFLGIFERMGVDFYAVNCLCKSMESVGHVEVKRRYLRLQALAKRNKAIAKLVKGLTTVQREQYEKMREVAGAKWSYHVNFDAILGLFKRKRA